MADNLFEDNLDDDEDGLSDGDEDDNDVVFGLGNINKTSMIKFINRYPDSALRFLLRRDLDGRPVRSEYEPIYENWGDRGLMRGRVKKYILNLMKWDDLPDKPLNEVVNEIRSKLAEMRLTNQK